MPVRVGRKLDTRGAAAPLAGDGGSAMPCGFMLPTAKANDVAADWLPELRKAAAVY
jgi:hypothetical protein